MKKEWRTRYCTVRATDRGRYIIDTALRSALDSTRPVRSPADVSLGGLFFEGINPD